MFGNTKQKGFYIMIVWREKADYFLGVNLTFDLLVEGTTLQGVMERIEKVSKDYLNLVREKKWSDDLLNKPAPKEYWKKALDISKKQKELLVERQKSEAHRKEVKSEPWVFVQQPYTYNLL